MLPRGRTWPHRSPENKQEGTKGSWFHEVDYDTLDVERGISSSSDEMRRDQMRVCRGGMKLTRNLRE